MFSSQLGRVARAGTQAASHSTCARSANSCASLSLSLSLTPAVLARPKQQRRLSSSKASCPPNAGDSNRARQTTPAQTATETARPAQRSNNASSSSSHSSGRKSTKTKANKEKDDVFDRLPSVPSTHHLNPSDITLSSFFSMHRPLSLTATIPPQTDMHTFNDIFTPKPNNFSSSSSSPSSASPTDVIYTLSNSIDRLNSAASEDVRWEIIQESPSNSDVKHLDGVPRAKTLEELIAQFRPFQAPPPPMPAVTSTPAKRTQQKQSQKTFKTTVIVTEKTDYDGSKSYTAATTPMEPVREPVKRTPFLDRMRRREYGRNAEDVEGEGMMAISVKRQRKLKMKKHKYKKLMKRTRNLRRRLDRN